MIVAAIVGLCSTAGFAAMFVPHPTVAFAGREGGLIPVDPAHAQKDWEAYGNTAGGSRFVALDQITRDNVQRLKVAWTYRTGDVAVSNGNGAEDQDTPLQIGDTLFICTPHDNVIALDADTGREKWKAMINAQASVWQRCRGLAYFDVRAPLQQPNLPGATPVTAVTVAPGAPCERRILLNTIDARLIALDADTGRFCPDFGTSGQVDLKAGIGDAPDPLYQQTSPPTVAGTTVVVGGRVADNVQVDVPGGVMRGFDVVTGRLRWAFDPGNPTITGTPPPGGTYARSTPNVWALLSAIQNDTRSVATQAESVSVADRSRRLSRRSFEVGNSGILQVLETERLFQRSSNGLVVARTRQFLNVARLYVATAGGWIGSPSDQPVRPGGG